MFAKVANMTEHRPVSEQLVRDDPVLRPCNINLMSREERFVTALKKTIYLNDKVLLNKDFLLEGNDMAYIRRYAMSVLLTFLLTGV